jgi:hypothetical protein
MIFIQLQKSITIRNIQTLIAVKVTFIFLEILAKKLYKSFISTF